MVCSASLRLSMADSISSSTILTDKLSGTPLLKLSARTYSGTEGDIIARVEMRELRLGLAESQRFTIQETDQKGPYGSFWR